MRRIVIAVMGTLSGLVLLFSYHTSTNSEAATVPGAGDGSQASGGSASGGSASGGSASGGSASAGSSSGGVSSSGTYTGDAVDTRWGTVQVRITVANGKITKAEAVQYPQDNPHDQEINAYAVPQLNAEVVQQQGAGIDAVSGATVTSGGYVQSLQSAIDQAHL